MPSRTKTKKETYDRGRKAETFAALYLKVKGYQVLARNYRPKKGVGAAEIDLIARKGDTLVFIEVKIRPSYDEAAYAITEKAKARLFRAAEIYLAEHPDLNGLSCRFDAVLFTSFFRLHHLENVLV